MERMVDGMDGMRKYGIFGLFHLDRLKSLNVKIDLIRFNWIGLGEIFGGGICCLGKVFGGGTWARYLEEVL